MHLVASTLPTTSVVCKVLEGGWPVQHQESMGMSLPGVIQYLLFTGKCTVTTPRTFQFY
jgi:hypothetical protein